MQRREFIRKITLGLIGVGAAPQIMATTLEASANNLLNKRDRHIKDYLHKMRNFDRPHKDDIKIGGTSYETFESTVSRLRRLQEYVGHGNFQLLSFDDGLKIAKNNVNVGRFRAAELIFLEMIFYSEADYYGFFGSKPLTNLTTQIKRDDTIKVPYTGNYLYKGLPYETFLKIQKLAGSELVLTSGIRGVMKQFLLFLNKAYICKGNLSLASRSLAPPGYSFHGIGDFDVGQRGLGSDNFTNRFTGTKVYRKLSEHGYLKLRYPEKNLLGVRFEPWHVKIA